MCELCNGTHVVHEIDSFSIRTSCCPVCGPVSDVVWLAELEAILEITERVKNNAVKG
jgi:hydrogenase maturation factor HypF (carbamoyltransferase family)